MQDNEIIKLENINKSFGDVIANKNINLKIHTSKIKALLGENGAGKSTLMAILAGHRIKDSGNIYVHGKLVNFSTEKDALDAGIGMVYQHFKLIENMSVTENIILGQVHGLLNLDIHYAQVQALADKYKLDIDPKAKIESLSMGEKQKVEILRLLYRNSQIFILDEPTAVLSSLETEKLFITLRSMASEGKAIVFISHKMKEVMQLADEIAILRRGEIVSEFAISEVPSEEMLAKRMIGHENLNILGANANQNLLTKEIFLEVNNLQSIQLGQKKPISFQLYKGSIFAIIGVAGNGQRTLADIVCNLSKDYTGEVTILNKDIKDFYKQAPTKNGLVYIAEDRRAQATIADFSLRDNFLLTNRYNFSNGPFILLKSALEICKRTIKNFNVKTKSTKDKASTLSGGNLQKFVLGRELYRNPKIVIAENPTQGLDLESCQAVWARLLELRSSAATLLVTSDIQEALNLADTLAVLYRGEIVDIFSRNDTNKIDKIGLMMSTGKYNA